MAHLSPTGARILGANENGMVAGHPAALARLVADDLVILQPDEGGTHWMTEAGWSALEDWRQANTGQPAAAAPSLIPPKLPGRQHEAVLTAARRPDQLVPGRDDSKVYWAGQPWFRTPTLRAVHRAGYAEIRPEPYDREPQTFATAERPLYLTPAGREYARLRENLDVRRRRVVIIACGSEKAPDPGVNEYGNPNAGYPAGELYTGHYHRSLRGAADALTDRSLIRILSAFHGLVDLDRPLHPYDVTIGDEGAVTADQMAADERSLGLDDADVIFLGGRDYAELLTPSVPHLLAPLTGGMGEQRGQCRQAREDSVLREAWWATAAELHETQHGK
ncbi:DUF6884 domain-containing protein [Streptomyces microflavus]|uniref:DUF6884 domain-containing protein n=1 Tax=Streptomyces microflavus TaxID=1919 RepID=UPI003663C466